MKNKHALVLGATGATGQELVKLLLKDSYYNKVSIFVRRKVDLQHKKLNIHIIDFSKLNDYENLIRGDILFSALGTTLKDAGSKNKQYLIDYSYQYEFAKISAKNGTNTYSVVSSLGANENSFFFYPKVKGKLEENIKLLDFKIINIYQPPSLIRQPELMRSSERFIIKILLKLNNIGMLKLFKPIHVNTLALKMVSDSHNIPKEKINIYKPIEILN